MNRRARRAFRFASGAPRAPPPWGRAAHDAKERGAILYPLVRSVRHFTVENDRDLDGSDARDACAGRRVTSEATRRLAGARPRPGVIRIRRRRTHSQAVHADVWSSAFRRLEDRCPISRRMALELSSSLEAR